MNATGHVGRFRAALAKIPFAKRHHYGLFVHPDRVDVMSRGELAARFRANDLPELADAIMSARGPRGSVVCFVDAREQDEPCIVVVDRRLQIRDIPIARRR